MRCCWITVPIIAIAPIVIVSLGRGFSSVAVVSAILGLFPIITSTTTGLLQVDGMLLDLFRLYRASRWQTLLKLRVPAALPYLISGIRIASGSSIVGAIVGEFFVGDGTPGLGSLIQRKSASLVLSGAVCDGGSGDGAGDSGVWSDHSAGRDGAAASFWDESRWSCQWPAVRRLSGVWRGSAKGRLDGRRWG
jgi:hypothetical protein